MCIDPCFLWAGHSCDPEPWDHSLNSRAARCAASGLRGGWALYLADSFDPSSRPYFIRLLHTLPWTAGPAYSLEPWSRYFILYTLLWTAGSADSLEPGSRDSSGQRSPAQVTHRPGLQVRASLLACLRWPRRLSHAVPPHLLLCARWQQKQPKRTLASLGPWLHSWCLGALHHNPGPCASRSLARVRSSLGTLNETSGPMARDAAASPLPACRGAVATKGAERSTDVSQHGMDERSRGCRVASAAALTRV